jgi:SRSO17 transposase
MRPRINYLRRFKFGARGADMNRKSEETSEARFAAYVEGLAGVLGHADRLAHCATIAPGQRHLTAARQSRWESRDNQDENAPLLG